jgi:hypothetical protein
MTPNKPPKHGPNNAVAYLVTFPFVALQNAASVAMRAHQRRAKPAPKTPPTTQPTNKTPTTSVVPPVAPTQMVADRVHSQLINGQSVNFYLYAANHTIRIMTRTRGVAQTAWFTRAIAEATAVPFTMVSAAAWIQETWFKSPIAAATTASPSEPSPAAAPVRKHQPQKSSAPAELDLPSTDCGLPENQPVPRASKPAAKTGTRRPMVPCTGEIIGFGPMKKGVNTKKPYWTYVMKIDSREEGLQEFVGEQLAELVASLELQEGQLITLTPLGKRKFIAVLEDGSTEERHRNEYAIVVHQ